MAKAQMSRADGLAESVGLSVLRAAPICYLGYDRTLLKK
jgi:hypothetical protein